MKTIDFKKVIVAISVCLLLGFVSAYATTSSIDNWYTTIKKPFFNPPNWIFGPVWTVLYILMGYSVAIIWRKKTASKTGKKDRKTALVVFVTQLILNGLWSLIFFGLCNPFLALIEILILWLLIYETIRFFKKIDAFAAKLLYPYLFWVSFATLLNGSIWFLNS